MALSRAIHDANLASGAQPPAYMCTWALRSIASGRSSAHFDFRRFYDRFNSAFGDRGARCVSDQPCNGNSPESCKRFVDTKVADQSAHDRYCSGHASCSRLIWDESSYRAVQGTRAVCISASDDRFLRYEPRSERTMAISHVWAHGQGGRPESKLKNGQQGGMNACLHHRYARIAEQVGCNSYWMDTPCIPEDDELRSQAIRGINDVFSNSKVTLVCDRDLMTINIAPLIQMSDSHESPPKAALLSCERILSTLLGL